MNTYAICTAGFFELLNMLAVTLFLSLHSEQRQGVKMSLFFVTFSILFFSSRATPIENHNKTLSSDDIEIIDSACKLRIDYIESLNKVCFQLCLECSSIERT